ncbi:hypothetical protein [Agarivorans sp.]|uniref:hypothetical protein n=1 Tax=Agarivorans sp. TaxID=1872412 RepID=UPI003D011683
MTTRLKLNFFYRSTSLALMLTSLVACSTMQPTDYGFNSASNGESVKEAKVRWHLITNDLSTEEKAEIENYVTDLLSEKNKQLEDKHLIIQAQITRIETVSPFLNTVSTLLVFLPLDRGGAAIELQATELETGRKLYSESYAKWMPLTEFTAHFSRTQLAKLALKDSIDAFFDEVKQKSGATVKG